MDASILKSYRWFRANGGTAKGSLYCARIEALLAEAVDEDIARVEWDYEQERYEDVFGFESDAERKRWYRDIEENRITGPYSVALYVEGELVASLGMVTLGPGDISGDPYTREVLVDLASEAQDEIRQALGDARDAEIEPLT